VIRRICVLICSTRALLRRFLKGGLDAGALVADRAGELDEWL